MSSSRNLPIVEYLRQLQLEYLLYQLRIKIYANSEDRKKFKEILTFKKEKITDICSNNGLFSIFDNEDVMRDVESEFYNEFGIPTIMTKKDKYFYFKIDSDFSYKGKAVKLNAYNLEEATCRITDSNSKIHDNIDINLIRRIL